MAAVRFVDDNIPEYMNRFEKLPAAYIHPDSTYNVEGLSRAMIAWMLDINVRATVKRREYDRTRMKIYLYIKHMERIMYQHGVPFTPYSDKPDNEMVKDSRQRLRPHMLANMVNAGPIPVTTPIDSIDELCMTVSDTQTMEYKLYQLNIIRALGRTDLPSVEEFFRSKRAHRPETQPRG